MAKRTWFTGFSRPVLAFLVLLPLAGAVILLTGINLEWPEWDRKSYLVNMVSALTGALFGIPIAVIVIQKVLADQAARVQGSEIDSLRDSAVKDLLDAMKVTSRFSLSSESLVEFGHLCSEGLALLRRSREPILVADKDGNEIEAGPTEVVHIRREIRRVFADIVEAIDGFDGRLTSEQASPWHVRHAWNFLDTYVNPRVREAGREWFSSSDYAELGRVLNEDLPDNSIIIANIRDDEFRKTLRFIESHSLRIGDHGISHSSDGQVATALNNHYDFQSQQISVSSFDGFVAQINNLVKVDQLAWRLEFELSWIK